ncbi:MAG: Flp family type IVb pilin [Stellaceae bacterium]
MSPDSAILHRQQPVRVAFVAPPRAPPAAQHTRCAVRLARLGGDETGVTAIEYALIAGLVAVVIVGAVTALGTSVSGLYSTVLAAF